MENVRGCIGSGSCKLCKDDIWWCIHVSFLSSAIISILRAETEYLQSDGFCLW